MYKHRRASVWKSVLHPAWYATHADGFVIKYPSWDVAMQDAIERTGLLAAKHGVLK